MNCRDHAISSSNRNQETDSTADSNDADDDNDDQEHVSVRISSFGQNRNRSGTNSSSEGNVQQNYSPKNSNLIVGPGTRGTTAIYANVCSNIQKPPSGEEKRSLGDYNNRCSGGYDNVDLPAPSKAEEEVCYFSSSEDEEDGINRDNFVHEVMDKNEIKTIDPAPMVSPEDSQEKSLVEIKKRLSQSTKVKPFEYVGFSKLPYQVYRRSVQSGFEFNLMILGESGLGKSSLINSMFWTDLIDKDTEDENDNSDEPIKSRQVLLQEGDVKLKLNILSLPGYGDNIDNSQCWKPVR